MKLVCILLFSAYALAPVRADPTALDGEPKRINVPIIIYHSIRPYTPSDTTLVRRYIVTPEVFEQELRYLKENAYKTISFDDLADYFRRGKYIPPRPVIICFDDGWQSQFDNAFPLLTKYSFTATFFIYPNAIGVPFYMRWDQVIQLRAAGMAIGCHTRSHPFLFKITDERELRREIIESKWVIESHLKRPITTFSYPFGLYTDRILALVKQAGYRTARSVYASISHSESDLFTLSARVMCESMESFLEALRE